jgi:hypothetical protein
MKQAMVYGFYLIFDSGQRSCDYLLDNRKPFSPCAIVLKATLTLTQSKTSQ